MNVDSLSRLYEKLFNMNKYFIYFISIVFLFSACTLGCEKEGQEEDEIFHVEVLGEGPDCGSLYLVKFFDDEEKVVGVTLNTNVFSPLYYAQNLKDEHKVSGLKLRITLGNQEKIESVACTSWGPAYDHIYIEDSEIESDQE